MNVFFLLCVVSGITVAWGLNKLLAAKIEDKNHRTGLKVISYIVCIVLSMAFFSIGSLRIMLDLFIEDRIEFIGTELSKLFPNSNILETSIDTSELVSVIDELQQMANTINTSGDGYFENLVFEAFLNTLTGYVYAVENGINTIALADDKDGIVTVRTILYNLKNTALETISPYFVLGQTGLVIILIIYIGVYAGIVAFLKKGGAMYNKSIVFGDINYDNSREKNQHKE
jgi:hypothetical protein